MVSGYCDERFLDAKEILEKSIDSGFELGCAISLEVKGEKVMDLWGGYVDPDKTQLWDCLLYTSPSPRDLSTSRMPSSA